MIEGVRWEEDIVIQGGMDITFTYKCTCTYYYTGTKLMVVHDFG